VGGGGASPASELVLVIVHKKQLQKHLSSDIFTQKQATPIFGLYPV
jgi:hypothetical protein